MPNDDLPVPLSIVPPPDPEAQPGGEVSLYPGQGQVGQQVQSGAAADRPPSGAAATQRQVPAPTLADAPVVGRVAQQVPPGFSAPPAAMSAAPAYPYTQPAPQSSGPAAAPTMHQVVAPARPSSLPMRPSGAPRRSRRPAGRGVSNAPLPSVAPLASTRPLGSAFPKTSLSPRGPSQRAGRGNRRRGPDLYVQLPWAFSVVASLLVLASMALTERATTNNHGVDRIFGIDRAHFYEPRWHHMAGGVLACSFVLTLLGLRMNSRRMRRKGDRYSRALILLCLLSGAGLVRYLLWKG